MPINSLYLFRFSDGRGHTQEFQSTLPLLPDPLSIAFLHFSGASHGRRALLEVHHHRQGWQPIYHPSGGYLYVGDLQQLDSHALSRAITYTLAVISHWSAQIHKSDPALIAQSEQAALLRRRQLRLVMVNQQSAPGGSKTGDLPRVPYVPRVPYELRAPSPLKAPYELKAPYPLRAPYELKAPSPQGETHDPLAVPVRQTQ